jgi:hypothetical protein
MDPPRPPARDWTRSVANTVITPPPPDIRIQQDESYPVPSIHAINYALQRLSAMKDQESVRFGLLDFTKCPIASIDILFPKQKRNSFGLLDPPLPYRANAKALRAWRKLGKTQQQSKIDLEDPARVTAHKRSIDGRLQRQTSRRKMNESVTPTPNDTGRANVTPTSTHESDDTPMPELDDTPMPESDDTKEAECQYILWRHGRYYGFMEPVVEFRYQNRHRPSSIFSPRGRSAFPGISSHQKVGISVIIVL